MKNQETAEHYFSTDVMTGYRRLQSAWQYLTRDLLSFIVCI